MGPTFSIILPVYKQADHIQILFELYVKRFASFEDSWELIFVVNGPEDGSYDILKNLAQKNVHIKVIKIDQGNWGAAIKRGFQEARGRYVCYTNSARTHVDDLIMVLRFAKVDEGHLVKATRILRKGFKRKLGTLLYASENRLFFEVHCRDINGTPKVLPRKFLAELEIQSDDNLFDAELMANCARLKVPVVEVPIFRTDRIGGKSTTSLRCALGMYWNLLRVRKHMRRKNLKQ